MGDMVYQVNVVIIRLRDSFALWRRLSTAETVFSFDIHFARSINRIEPLSSSESTTFSRSENTHTQSVKLTRTWSTMIRSVRDLEDWLSAGWRRNACTCVKHPLMLETSDARDCASFGALLREDQHECREAVTLAAAARSPTTDAETDKGSIPSVHPEVWKDKLGRTHSITETLFFQVVAMSLDYECNPDADSDKASLSALLSAARFSPPVT